MPIRFLLAGLVLFLVSCSSSMSGSDVQSYNSQKSLLARQERAQPLSFLKVYASDKKNMFGSTVVKGVVSNTASISSYKNIRLKLLSYDASGKMLEEHEDVLNGLIRPNDSKDFKLRYHLPHSSDSVAVSIMSAAVVE